MVNDNLDSFPGNIWTGESVASVALADIHHHNKLRALEAHFFHTIMGNMLQTPEEHKDSSRSLELLCDRSLPSISIAAEKCLETQENSTAEPKCVQVDDIATAMQRIRRGVSCVIRDRKLSKDRAWHNHGDNYLGTMHKWKAHIRDIEAKAEELYHHGPQLRGSNSNPHSTRVFQSAMLGDRRADVESKPVTSIGRPESEVQYSAVRSDYEQDKIVHELWSSEWRQLKIERGLVRVPTMKSPWPFADASRQAIAPNWPSDVREISMIVADPAPVKTSPPLVLHDTNDLIDFSGSRLTTDGKRQLCSSLELGVQCSANCNCAYQVEKLRSTERIWSDMEKCIFVDKFLQFPKNFYRISTFLPNRSVKDCVKFYYDAKYSLEFKQLLKEYDNRRRQVKANWQLSLRAAHFTGGAVYPTNEHESKDFLVQTPLDDLYFKTFSCQPLYSPKLLAVPISIDFLKSCIDGEDGKYQLTQQYPRLQVLRESLRRRMGAALGFDAVQEFGAAASLQKPRKRRFDGDDEYDADIGELIEFSGRIDESQRSSPVLSCEPFGSGYQYSCSAWCLTNVLSSMYSYPRAESRPIPRTFTSELLELDQNQRRGNMEKLTLSFDSNSSGHDHLHHDNSHGGRFGGGRGRGGRSYSNSQNVNRHSVTAGLSPALDNAQRAPGGRGRGRGRARIGAAGVGLGRGRGGRGRLATNSDGSSTAVSSSHAETQG